MHLMAWQLDPEQEYCTRSRNTESKAGILNPVQKHWIRSRNTESGAGILNLEQEHRIRSIVSVVNHPILLLNYGKPSYTSLKPWLTILSFS